MSEEFSMDQVFLKQLNAVIEAHLEDEQFSVEELAMELGLSRSQLHRKLNAINGKSTSQYIREYRLEKAMELLQNNVATASEIAYRVGFGSPTYFNKSFREFYGYPPGEVKIRATLSHGSNEESLSSDKFTDTITIKRRLYDLRSYIIGALVLILIVMLGYYNYANSESTETAENEKTNTVENSIAVLPFKNISGNPDNEAFCDGMTNAIISRLSKIKGIKKVISQTSMMNYKDNKKAMTLIADELDVHYILESSFQKAGNDIKINIQLIDGPLDKLYWSEEYVGKYDSIFNIQAHVAEMVAKQLDADITEEEQKNLQQAMTTNTEAYDYYLKGEYKKTGLSLNSVLESIRFFEKAIELDSLFVEPYISLWGNYIVLGTWHGNMSREKADSLGAPYLKKALQLDPDNLQLLHGLANTNYYKWNFKFADSLYKVLRKRGLKYVYDEHLNLMHGRYDLVIKNDKKMFKEDPYKTMGSYMTCAYAYYYKGQIDSTLYMIKEGLRISPFQEAYYDHFGNLYLALGDYKEAKNLLEKGLEISDQRHASMLVHLALVYHYLNDEEKSLGYLNEVIARANAGEPEINVFVSHYYSRMGDLDEAFKWLDIAYEKHEVDLIWLPAEPNLQQLKEDPRYQKLVKKIGFLEIK